MEEQIEAIHEFSGLGKRFDHPVYTYSSGMQIRVRFATITSLQADVLLVDEGIGTADHEFNIRANERLSNFYQKTATLLIASHSQELLDTHCEGSLTVIDGLHLVN